MDNITDLKYLEGVCNGDPSRMQRYIDMFLKGAPPLFEQMEQQLQAGEDEALSRTAHSLKPQANYMGATALFLKLQELEIAARDHGTGACQELLAECQEMSIQAIGELRLALQQFPS